LENAKWVDFIGQDVNLLPVLVREALQEAIQEALQEPLQEVTVTQTDVRF
jgi:hypothetical protein